MRPHVFVLFIAALLSFCGKAQHFPIVQWAGLNSEEIFSIQADSTLNIWSENHWKTTDTLSFIDIDIRDLEEVEALNLVPGSSELLFTAPGTGQVYILNLDSLEFRRKDKTYHRGYNFHAIQWVKNDTLYSLGGYGFWHTQSILSYYHEASREWQVIETKGGPNYITNDFYQWTEDKEDLYVTWMSQIYGSEGQRIDEVWKLNVPSRQWSRVGTLNEDIVRRLEIGKGLLLPIGYYLRESRELIDIIGNRVDHIDATVADIQIHKGPASFDGEGFFLAKDAILDFYVPKSSSLGESVGFRYTYDSILNARRIPESVYQVGWPWWYYVSTGAGGLLLVYVVLRLIQKVRQPFRKGSTLMAEEAFFRSLDPLEVKLLRALLRSEMRGEGLKSGPITDIMGWTDKSWDNQRKWRNNLIKELNRRAQDHLNIDELIQRERDPKDKRERVYRLEGNGFRLLRDSLHFTS